MKNPLLKTITTVSDVTTFFTFLIVVDGLNFHPNTPPSDYIGKHNKPTYTPQEAAERATALQQCFIVCKKEHADIYSLALNLGNIYLAKYINSEFRNHLLDNETYLSSEYGYTIEFVNDGRAEYWELTTQTTSMSEIDGADEGIIDHYQYLTKEEALQDIHTANQFSKVYFEEI